MQVGIAFQVLTREQRLPVDVAGEAEGALARARRRGQEWDWRRWEELMPERLARVPGPVAVVEGLTGGYPPLLMPVSPPGSSPPFWLRSGLVDGACDGDDVLMFL
ncbi:MAG: hypothetical protein M5U01_31505 [Ardenticatenaceae bacterium]|nr:hypothetical protein [Ardenticatenaceae bacterium]HBY94590.1 hypothetical protein [Chloroflexota bacterium]